MSTGPIRITDYLRADHERLHALIAGARTLHGLDHDKYAAFRRALLRHIGIEEKLLLPAARRARGGERISRARELRLDHAALTSLLVPTPDLALCAEIVALLAVHDQKEEGAGGVYAECERLLDPDEALALGAQAAAFPEVPVAPHFDGHGVSRTAAEAVASASRLRWRTDV